jgi:hypothetical protein
MQNDSCLFFPNGLNRQVRTTCSKGGEVVAKGTVLSVSTGPQKQSSASVEGYLPIYLNHEEVVKVALNVTFAVPQDGLEQLLGI